MDERIVFKVDGHSMHIPISNQKLALILACLFTFIFSLNLKINSHKLYLESDVSLSEVVKKILASTDDREFGFSPRAIPIRSIEYLYLQSRENRCCIPYQGTMSCSDLSFIFSDLPPPVLLS